MLRLQDVLEVAVAVAVLASDQEMLVELTVDLELQTVVVDLVDTLVV